MHTLNFTDHTGGPGRCRARRDATPRRAARRFGVGAANMTTCSRGRRVPQPAIPKHPPPERMPVTSVGSETVRLPAPTAAMTAPSTARAPAQPREPGTLPPPPPPPTPNLLGGFHHGGAQRVRHHRRLGQVNLLPVKLEEDKQRGAEYGVASRWSTLLRGHSARRRTRVPVPAASAAASAAAGVVAIAVAARAAPAARASTRRHMPPLYTPRSPFLASHALSTHSDRRSGERRVLRRRLARAHTVARP